MAAHPFRIVNVFTQDQRPFTGNPLCVFENGGDLSCEQMQSLARQFNLSETTFILPSARANARVRIFTPAYEMAFAGHPTLGSAHVCRALKLGGDSLVLEMQAGARNRRTPAVGQGGQGTVGGASRLD
jgi:trans-2,3-dihydro-3-hydroxyanthranilate isomerase